jgi:Fe-S-cluster containining protein
VARYRDLLARADAWFAQAAQAHAGEVRCALSCTLCCHGLFDISPLDAALLEHGMRAAPRELREELGRAAAGALEPVRQVAPEWDEPWGVGALGDDRFDEVCEALALLRCPALDAGGACRLYEHRPLICRLHGIPMYDPEARGWLGGECELNFPPDGRRSDRTLWFDNLRFERDERQLAAELSEAAAGRYVRTIIPAVLLRAATEPPDPPSDS